MNTTKNFKRQSPLKDVILNGLVHYFVFEDWLKPCFSRWGSPRDGNVHQKDNGKRNENKNVK